MWPQLKRILLDSGVYGLGIVVSKATGFLMISVYTTYLKPQDYGILELLDLIIFFAALFTSLGMHASVFRFYSHYESQRDKDEVITTALYCYAVAAFIASVLIYLSASAISVQLFKTAAHAHLVKIVAGTFFFTNISEVPFAYWRAQGRPILFSIVSLVKTILGAGTLAIALAVLKLGVHGAVLANFFANAIAGSALFLAVFIPIRKKAALSKLYEMLHYGLPLIPASFASFVIVFSDRFFLTHFGNLNDVGIYSLSYKLAMVVTVFITTPFNLVWQSQQFEIGRHENAKEIFSEVMFCVVALGLFAGLAISIFAKNVLHWLSPAAYWSAAVFVPIIIVSYIFDMARLVVMSGIYIERKTHALAAIAVVVTLTNLALNYLLIPRYLAFGAAVATVISYAVNFGLCYFLAQRVYGVRYRAFRTVVVVVAATVLYLASLADHGPELASVFINLLLLSAFCLACLKVSNFDVKSLFQLVARRGTGIEEAEEVLEIG